MIFHALALIASILAFRHLISVGEFIYAYAAGITAAYFLIALITSFADRVTGAA